MKTVGFIGCGNMGGALIRAAAKVWEPSAICLYDVFSEKAEKLAADTGARTAKSLSEIAEADFIFLGVKPQGIADLFDQLRPLLGKKRTVLISMLAGVSMDRIRKLSGTMLPVIRIMPNLAASVGEGMILYDFLDVEQQEVKDFCFLLSEAGRIEPLEEKLIDAGSAVSGCGPAYAFMFADALADGGVKCGLKRADARILAAQTLLGAAKLLLETGSHPDELKDAVCSPGGSTIEGVLALEEGAFRGCVAEAVVRAWEKNKELGK